MKNIITSIICSIALIFGLVMCPIIYFNDGPKLTAKQEDILIVLLIIMSVSILYCFVVGEITRNNSQMDKLWSILPIIYSWVIAGMGGMSLRLVITAILITIWGIRLTINFGRKGAYKLKFWQGEEDYRWVFLRKTKIFRNKFVWALFDLFFISIYQNVLVLLITLPLLMCVGSVDSFNYIDIIAIVLSILFVIYELVADEQQWKFQSKKWSELNSGKKLSDLDYPYNLGFNTTGLWRYSSHPNYFGEQAFWVSIYIFSIASGADVFNYYMFGPLLLILLFIGSSTFGEYISSTKYPEYKKYSKKVFRYIPLIKYK